MKGTFIVLEGPDGSGTTTHAAILATRLQYEGYDVLSTQEPTNDAIGRFIRDMLQKETIPSISLQMLFCADRAAHLERTVIPALSKGHIVVCDRYILSTLMYGKALGIAEDMLISMNKYFIQPTVQLLALPSFEVCQQRLGKRSSRDILENDTLQKKVYDAYNVYASNHSESISIDTSKDRDSVADLVYDSVRSALPQK